MSNYLFKLTTLNFKDDIGNELILTVSTDALMVEEKGKLVRKMFTPIESQKVMDSLGGILPTVKIADEIHLQAIRHVPCPVLIDGVISALATEQQFTEEVNDYLSKFEDPKPNNLLDTISEVLIGNYHKYWIMVPQLISKQLKGFNYGYMAPNPSKMAPKQKSTIKYPYASKPLGLSLFQPLSSVHNLYHKDASQLLRFVSKYGFLNDQEVDLNELISNKEYSHFLNYGEPFEAVKARY